MSYQVWCDVGGTFTDCFVVQPDGQRHYTKVLSSGVVKGSVERWIAETVFRDPARCQDPNGFWVGSDIRWTDQGGKIAGSQRCVGFDAATGTFQLAAVDSLMLTEFENQRLQNVRSFATPPEAERVRYEIVSGLEAPVLAVRLLLRCHPLEALPALQIRLGTTRGTNALLTRNGEPCAFVTTHGFADLLRIGYQERPELFALNVRKRTPLHVEVVEIHERLSADGSILRPLDSVDAEQKLRRLFDRGIRSIAICLLHAYCNPAHELALKEIAENIGFTCICVSSTISPKIKAVLRGETTLVDAYLTPVVRDYLARVSDQFGLKGSGNLTGTPRLRVMTSSGGLVAAEAYRGKDSVLSGPAGGAVAIESIAKALQLPKCIGLDMGGTSTDVCRIDGELQLEHETIKAGVRMMTPTLAIHTVAAGGGSVCWFDGVQLRVGPQSAGADPGPACYGRGGPLTVTDLNVLVGRIDVASFPFSLDTNAASHRLSELLVQINAKSGSQVKQLDALMLIDGFRKIANEHMAAAVRSISIAQGADPRDHTLIGFGGAAGQHICEIAELLGITHVIDPPEAGLLSALGMGLASIQRSLSRPIYRRLELLDGRTLQSMASEMRSYIAPEFEKEGLDATGVANTFKLEMRYVGNDGTLMVDLDWSENSSECVLDACSLRFTEQHRQRFGYDRPGKGVEVVSLHGAFRSTPAYRLDPSSTVHSIHIKEPSTQSELSEPSLSMLGVVYREKLLPGHCIAGPMLVVSAGSTTAVPSGWTARVLTDRTLSLQLSRVASESMFDRKSSLIEEAIDPILREVLAQRIAAIADQMGIVLEQTAISVNVKDRRDFSCAVFAANGDLIANAPHVPVHLGAMSDTIRRLIAIFPRMEVGDCFVTNDPYQGGSHLPDITVVTPVFVLPNREDEPPDFFVACRAHHAEIGGITPGSMAPTATRLGQEGVVILPMHLTKRGVDRSGEVEQLLHGGKYPSRSVPENMADLVAQQAANQRGMHAMTELAGQYGLDRVKKYLQFILQASETKTRAWIATLAETPYRFRDAMDDGTVIAVALGKQIDPDGQVFLRVDFSDSGPVSKGNLNANPAIVTAAVMYVIRCAVADSLPLNSGVMRCVELIVPVGILNPPCVGERDEWPAVAGGNVETSQRIVDCLLGALGLAAASQGTMNNFLFGDASFGYYETIGGGTGATPDGPGEDAVHSHMTNTRLTDVEVLESCYPVRLERFSIRAESGGVGLHRGGNGIVRQVLALKRLDVSLVTSRRTTHPFGLQGGGHGKAGENWLIRRDGQTVPLPSSALLSIETGESILIQTPGGGAMKSADNH